MISLWGKRDFRPPSTSFVKKLACYDTFFFITLNGITRLIESILLVPKVIRLSVFHCNHSYIGLQGLRRALLFEYRTFQLLYSFGFCPGILRRTIPKCDQHVLNWRRSTLRSLSVLSEVNVLVLWETKYASELLMSPGRRNILQGDM